MLCRGDRTRGGSIVGAGVELELSLLWLRMLWMRGELRGHTGFVSRVEIVEQRR